MKRIISTIMLCTVLLTSLWITVSCTAFSPLNDEQVREILRDLIPRSAEINEIFWGRGLPTVEYDESELPRSINWKYYEVTSDCKYQSIAEIDAAASQVFTYKYLQIMYQWAFLGIDGGMPRYSENDKGKLERNVMDNGFEYSTVFHIEEARVKSGYGDSVTVIVPADVEGEPYGDIELVLVRENGVWLLDSPTY